jgi:hypothetical protein
MGLGLLQALLFLLALLLLACQQGVVRCGVVTI